MQIVTNPTSMIASLSGRVSAVGLDFVIIECGGVGYCVNVTPQCASCCELGSQMHIHTALIVREDAMVLYGFLEDSQRRLFYQLQTVSGVGPRLALAALATLSAEIICQALTHGEVAILTKIPGVGKRVAERLIIELKDKVILPTHASAATVSQDRECMAMGAYYEDVIEALQGLGFARKEIMETINSIIAEDDKRVWDAPTLIKTVLQALGKHA